MKRLLDRYGEELKPEEERRLIARLERARPTPLPGDSSPLRRWTLSFGVAALTLVLVGAVLTRTDLGREGLGLGRWRILNPRGGMFPSGPAGREQIRETKPDAPANRAYGFPAAEPGPGAPFVRTEEDSLSGFALAVTSDSYRETRRSLESGHLPAPEVVRVEEFLRYFQQDYQEFPEEGARLHLDGALSPYSDDTEILRVGVKAGGSPSDSRGPARVVARAARVALRFHPGTVERYRLLGFEAAGNGEKRERDPGHGPRGAAGREARDSLPGADLRAGEEAVALYEVKLRGLFIPGRVVTARLTYATAAGVRADEQSLVSTDFAAEFEGAPARLRFDALVARFAAILRYPGWKGDRLAVLLPQARAVARELTADPAVGEFAELVRRAADLADRPRP